MSILAFLSSAIGGTLLSGVQQLAQEWFAVRRMEKESQIKVAEMRALAEIKIEEKQLEAFVAAQGSIQSSWQPGPSSPTWLVCAFGIAEIIIKLIRPAMVVFAFWFLNHMYELANPEARGALDSEIMTFCFAVGYMWIGQRYQTRLSFAKRN